MKYRDWLIQWLNIYIKPTLKEKTYVQYSNIVRLHLVPALGNKDISDLTPMVVQQFITQKLESGNIKNGKGLSPNTVNLIIAVMQSSLEIAHAFGIISEYSMGKIKRPKIKEKKIECFTKEEQKKIEQYVLKDKRDKMKGILLCLYTGIRIGELLALEWSDIDLKKSEMTINKTCHDGKNEKGRFCRITNLPKTDSSLRTIPVPIQLLPILKELKKKSVCNYVIADGTQYISVRSYQRSFELLQKKLKISHHGFHALRHTFATRAIENGMDVKSLSEILGHKSPAITLKRYVHSLMDHKKSMMNKLGKML